MNKNIKILLFIILLLVFFFLVKSYWNPPSPAATEVEADNTEALAEEEFGEIEDGIHLQTGLVFDDNFEIILANCTTCHSGKLISQNRATRDGWQQMIRWMQKSQGLWDLGSNESIILDYLAKHYAPKETGRRANLDIASVEWYILNLE